MKKVIFVFMLGLLLAPATVASAQTTRPFSNAAIAQSVQTFVVDHWATADACVAAQSAPFYVPSKRDVPLGPDERVGRFARNSCVEMILPDRIGGRGFVKAHAGDEFVYSVKTGAIVRFLPCNNDVFGWVEIPDAPVAPAQAIPVGPLTMNVNVTGTNDVNVHVDGKVEVDQVVSGTVVQQQREDDRKVDKGDSHWVKWVVIGAVAAVGTGLAIHFLHHTPGPVATTLPPTAGPSLPCFTGPGIPCG